MDISRDRARQPASSHGMGAHYTSPIKKRPGKRKTQVMATVTFDAARKRQRLEARIDEIMSKKLPCIPEEQEGQGKSDEIERLETLEELPGAITNQGGEERFDTASLDGFHEDINYRSTEGPCTQEEASPKKKRITPDQATFNLYEKWKVTLPCLVDDLLAYATTSVGAPLRAAASELNIHCLTPASCLSDMKSTNVTCLYYDRMLNLLFDLQIQ